MANTNKTANTTNITAILISRSKNPMDSYLKKFKPSISTYAALSLLEYNNKKAAHLAITPLSVLQPI